MATSAREVGTLLSAAMLKGPPLADAILARKPAMQREPERTGRSVSSLVTSQLDQTSVPYPGPIPDLHIPVSINSRQAPIYAVILFCRTFAKSSLFSAYAVSLPSIKRRR